MNSFYSTKTVPQGETDLADAGKNLPIGFASAFVHYNKPDTL